MLIYATIKKVVDALDISTSLLVRGQEMHKDERTQRGNPRVTSYSDLHNKA